jgi:hypothetical protein
MKHLIILVVIFISTSAFSQSPENSTIQPMAVDSITISKLDFDQIERINNIEQNIDAFYTNSRISHKCYFLSFGLTIAGAIISNIEDPKVGGVLIAAGGLSGIIGTVIYFDSYKFLNFKREKKEVLESTYY